MSSMRTAHAALDTIIATVCGAVALVVFLPVLLLATGVKTILPARATSDPRPLAPGPRAL
jgi:hypothetical protein